MVHLTRLLAVSCSLVAVRVKAMFLSLPGPNVQTACELQTMNLVMVHLLASQHALHHVLLDWVCWKLYPKQLFWHWKTRMMPMAMAFPVVPIE